MATATFPNLSTLKWLIVSLSLVSLPHLFYLFFWVLPTLGGLLAWRFINTYRQRPQVKTSTKIVLVVGMLLGIIASYGTIFGRDAGIAFLVLLSGLKLLETDNLRDATVVCFLGYFLIITNFLYSQSIPTALYMIVVMIITTATLISLSDTNNQLLIQKKLRLSTTLILQALPVMFVLFIFFPRVAGPFWSLPRDAHSGITGLSETMSLGNINQLTQSDEIAFRVKFDGEIPPIAQRYWRGPVLWWTNGRDWKPTHRQDLLSQPDDFEPLGQAYEYTITLEPHNQRWLFALDLPEKAPAIGRLNGDYQVLAKKMVRERIRYNLRSYIDYNADGFILSDYQKRLSLNLPKQQNPQTHTLAKQWQQTFKTPEAIINQALRYFNQQNFYYTLQPPLLTSDHPIDEFLFKSQRGFCEYYAAAFTVLMRAVGVPTRIVTGYQGGEQNPLDDYLVVRQRDAHAWTEVWIEEKGWIRVDPTSAVSPERIEEGIDIALPPTFNPLGIDFNWGQNSLPAKILQQLNYGWDALNNSWNQWVLGYGPEKQMELMKLFGLNIRWPGMILILTGFISFIVLTIAIWMFFRPRQQEVVLRLYTQFCKKLAQKGLPRYPAEGPLDYAKRIKSHHPELAHTVQQITYLYLQIRYRSRADKLPALRQAIRTFKLT